MHKNSQKCVWEKTPPLSGKNPTPSLLMSLARDAVWKAMSGRDMAEAYRMLPTIDISFRQTNPKFGPSEASKHDSVVYAASRQSSGAYIPSDHAP